MIPVRENSEVVIIYPAKLFVTTKVGYKNVVIMFNPSGCI